MSGVGVSGSGGSGGLLHELRGYIQLDAGWMNDARRRVDIGVGELGLGVTLVYEYCRLYLTPTNELYRTYFDVN